MRALWREYRETGSLAIRDQLFWMNYPLIPFCLKKLSLEKEGYWLPSEEADLAQYGSIGLLNAMQQYDPDRERSFSTYACIRILQQIRYGMLKLKGISRRAYRAGYRKRGMKGKGIWWEITSRSLREPLHLSDIRIMEEEWLRYDEERSRKQFETERIRLCLDRLEPLEQALLRRIFYDRCSLCEAGRQLGLPRWKARECYQRALENMKKLL